MKLLFTDMGETTGAIKQVVICTKQEFLRKALVGGVSLRVSKAMRLLEITRKLVVIEKGTKD
jgi:hypothetical protein